MYLPLSIWLKKYGFKNAADNFSYLNNFVGNDNELITSVTRTDLDIVSKVIQQN